VFILQAKGVDGIATSVMTFTLRHDVNEKEGSSRLSVFWNVPCIILYVPCNLGGLSA
jgi:hypothetical protein